MKQANLELSIEQLLLPDLPYHQRVEVTAALEQELTRLWNEQGLPSGFVGESLALSIAKVEVAASTPPAIMGVQVAQSIYNQMGSVNPPGATAARSNL